MLKLLFLCLFFALMLVVLSSCESARLVSYVHGASNQFYQTSDVDNPELDSFKVDEVLLVINVKAIDFENYVFWLGLYSKVEDKVIHVKACSAVNADFFGEGSINATVTLERESEGESLYKKSVKLFVLERKALEDHFAKNQSLDLEIFVEDEIGRESKLTFKLERREEKQTIFPT